MRLPELSMIKKLRKQIGVNQTELAKAAGVSQSLVARIELSRVDPSYSNTRNIFLALERLGKGKIRMAKDIMSRKILCAKPNTAVKEAVSLMRRKNVSQLPVLDDDLLVGSVSEKTILDLVTNGGIENVSLTAVKEIMEEPFPVIDENATLSVVSLLLEYNSAIVVTEKGKPKGIVTKSDLLKLM
ncbi:MAG: CBS domain-containing protein [Candidatus Aenigmarchaeota archaeon]|nr:CBS domain-containing protein [Candidatus Aenigmarchaeota archaeon]